MLIKAREFRVAPHALMFDPQLYVYDFLPKQKLTRFLVVDEGHLDLAPFIDIKFEPMALGQFSISSMELLSLERQHNVQRQRSPFIFHHAFVCSTLLARCLGQIDAFFSLKEPWILRRLADIKRSPGSRIPSSQWKQLFVTHIKLLAKNYKTGTAPVIKATNVANNLLDDVLKFLPGHRSLYLYSDLESFLVSNLKKTDETKQKMPDLAKGFINDEGFARAHPQYSGIDGLSLLQVCALIWVINLHNFRAVMERRQGQDVRTLDMRVFLDDPAINLKKLSTFFGHQPSDQELARMVSPDVLESNAKHPQQRFNTETRKTEAALIRDANARDIEHAVNWIGPLVRDLDLLQFMKTHQL